MGAVPSLVLMWKEYAQLFVASSQVRVKDWMVQSERAWRTGAARVGIEIERRGRRMRVLKCIARGSNWWKWGLLGWLYR